MYILKLIILICILNAKCSCKSIPKVVARSGLQCLTIVHQRLDRISCLSTCEFLFVCLTSLDNRNCKHVLAEIRIHIQHLDRSCLCLFCCCMCGMAFLPQELSRAKEWSCLLLPTHNGTPLVIYLWKITVALDLFRIKITEQCLGCWSDTQALLQFIQSAMCDPCNLRCESFDMILLLLEQALRNKHWKVYILYAGCLETLIEILLDQFPDRVACRFENHTSLYACVITQLCFTDNVRIPLCKILIHRCNMLY